MKKRVTATCVAVMVGVGLSSCSSMGSMGGMGGGAGNLFSMLGGGKINSMASDLVSRTIKDPRLSSLTSGRTIDPQASSTRVSNQMCSMLGGGCPAPLSETDMANAASRVSPEQSRAIDENFNSSLSSTTTDPSVRDKIREALGSKMPGIIGGIL